MVHTMDPEKIEREKVYAEMGLSDAEYAKIKQIMKRRPNYTETGIFSVMWSEHCSYKSSKPLLRTFPTEGEQVIMGPGEGAGVVDIGDGQAVVFKMESHNSPSYVDPFQGAATGVGGIVRDVFSMGAKPIALLNSLRFGSLGNKKTNHLYTEVIRGMAHYGNTLGVPTVGGEVQFDDSYEENPLVNAMCVGLIDQEDIQTGIAAGTGNSVIYAGGDTGRDGIHGATFSSDEVEGEEDHTSSVAIGNPEIEKRLIDACLEVIQSDALIGMQDMGAAGLTSSASEMASKAGTGIALHMEHVPQREEQMSAYEMMLSESQERMLLVVKKGSEQDIIDLFTKHDVEAVVIGEVIEEKKFNVYHDGELMASIPVDALDKDAPVYYLPSKEAVYYAPFQAMGNIELTVDDFTETLYELLKRPTIASKHTAYDAFNSEVQGNTRVHPGSGAGIVHIPETNKAIAMTADSNSRYIYLDPEVGGKIAVAEAARNLVVSGARPLALTDGLNYGNPTNEEVFWQMEESIKGISEACEQLQVPVVSGNVSLYNQSKGEPIFPTPIIGMVGLVDSTEHITPNAFQQAGDLIYMIGETSAEFGGSELQHIVSGTYEGKPPAIDLKTEQKHQQLVLEAIQEGLVTSAEDVAEGGLSVTLAECMIRSNALGIDVDFTGDATTVLFSESQSRFIVTVAKENKQSFEQRVQEATHIGRVTNDNMYTIRIEDEIVLQEEGDKISTAWNDAISSVLKSTK